MKWRETGRPTDAQEVPSLSDAIAANVRAERARHRWTQTELAQRLGWATSTLGDLESGKRRVSADDLPTLCEVFEIDLIELVRRADPSDLRRLGL